LIPHWSSDPFAERTTIHGLPSDEVRSALHKHTRRGRVEQSIRCALELARTDEAHEAMLWQRLRVIAAEDVGLADPVAPAIIGALHDSALLFEPGAFERLEFAAQAAAYVASAVKDPTAAEIMQLVLHEDRVPEIPDEAICIHTKRGQEEGRTLYDWWVTGAVVSPEAPNRDTAWRDELTELYRSSGAG
jgi:replication-associated recombination protein RarA